MANSVFQFRHFQIQQAVNPAKVGTDGILLGAWADVVGAKRILDVGTGTGLLAIMAAQRNPNAHIDAIEIREDCAGEASQNACNSPWGNRILVIASDASTFCPLPDSYDRLISNPPYFHAQMLPISNHKEYWRHQTQLSTDDLFILGDLCLSGNGKIELILPTKEGEQAIIRAATFGWHCQRKIAVLPTPQKPASRLLLSFSRIPQKTILDQIIIQTGGPNEYSPEFIRLTRDFYPWMV